MPVTDEPHPWQSAEQRDETEKRPVKALILAGGGLKVAFQAGVLQVWLDEAGLEFDIADGASGGVFNLTMWCEGRSGTEIADTWRRTNPLDFFELNPRPWVSLSRLERFRHKVLRPVWQIDWDRVRACQKPATFNVYDYTAEELRMYSPAEMTEERLLAGVSLPIWFPPVDEEGQTLIDAVFATDSNLEAAIRAGADELWIIWTIPRRGTWRNNPVNEYFAMIENAANWNLTDLLRRIDESNAAIAANRAGEFDHHVEYKILYGDVPLHYVLVFSATRVQRAVELGVDAARKWCIENKVPLVNPPRADGEPTQLSFSERMRGAIAFGVEDPLLAWQAGAGADLALHATIRVAGVRHFLTQPRHLAGMDGTIVCDALGGPRTFSRGDFELFEQVGPDRFLMTYRAYFEDGTGHPLTLAGVKHVPQQPSRGPWGDTTTLEVRILRGHVTAERERGAEVVAAGIIRLSAFAFLRQLLSFRASGPGGYGQGVRLVLGFFWLFLRTLWRVYV